MNRKEEWHVDSPVNLLNPNVFVNAQTHVLAASIIIVLRREVRRL
jgi:hypothetical protein